jgi:hypothetical protein
VASGGGCDGSWDDADCWRHGAVPASGNNIAILEDMNLDVDRAVTGLDLSSGKTFSVASGSELTLNGGVTGSGILEVSGGLAIGGGGFTNIAPTYATGATLTYNSGTTYGRSTEWSSTTGSGYPHHVVISNNTTVNVGANGGTNTARQIAGDLTIDAGSTLSLNETGEQMEAAVTILGDMINNGTVTLSGQSGGDLVLHGDFDDNGTFTANSRAVFFEGANVQEINSTSSPLEIDVMRITVRRSRVMTKTCGR